MNLTIFNYISKCFSITLFCLTDCLASTDIDGEANKGAAGEYVIIENGKLKGTATQGTDTGLKSLGKMNVAGHVMFGFVVTK